MNISDGLLKCLINIYCHVMKRDKVKCHHKYMFMSLTLHLLQSSQFYFLCTKNETNNLKLHFMHIIANRT